MAKVLKVGGRVQIKTDHDGYFEWMKEVILTDQTFFDVKMLTHDLYQEHPKHFLAQFQTKFEKIFLGQGTKIKAMELVRRM